jgi:preprotein translocase subunit SecE
LFMKKTGKKKTPKDQDNPATKPEASAPAAKLSLKKGREPEEKKFSLLNKGQETLKEKMAFIQTGLNFLKEVQMELKKVTWPNRKEALTATAVVVILSVIVSIFLGLIDVGLSSLITRMIR